MNDKTTFTPLNEAQLEELLTRAAKSGAKEALCSVGLHDDDAGNDIRDLRQLVDGWRSVKRTAVRTFVHWVVVFVLGLIAMGAWSEWHK